jgi:beta-carotene ketolase (CrtO type)
LAGIGDTYDAIVIGAGHNGLACACYLARAGLHVVVLEQYPGVGGMTLTEELTLPGFRSDVHASGYQLANVSPAASELELARHGVELIEPRIAYAHAFPDGACIAVGKELDAAERSIARFSAKDGTTVRGLFERYRDERESIIAAMFAPPPSLAAAARMAEEMPGGMDRYRFSLQSVRSWCDELFEAEETKCLFAAFSAFVGHGPDDAAGAEISWLFASVLQAEGNKLVRGGMNQVTLAMAAHLDSLGGVVRTGASVEEILVRSGKAVGVRLRGGEEVAGGIVASSADPAQLVLKLLGERVVGSEIADKARRIEWGDSVFVIYMALDGPVEYTAGPDVGDAAHVHLTGGSLAAMAAAVDECRAGSLPAAPSVVSWNDATIDPSRAPDGKDLKKLVVLGVPFEISGDATGEVGIGTWDEVRERYADHVVEMTTAHYMPDLRERTLTRVAHSPLDIERKLSSAVRGTIPHGAPLPYQSGALRPIPELGGYRSPVSNVYLCGSGSHPGAGVSMAPGRNAAQVICTDLGLDFRAAVAAAEPRR